LDLDNGNYLISSRKNFKAKFMSEIDNLSDSEQSKTSSANARIGSNLVTKKKEKNTMTSFERSFLESKYFF